MAHSPLPSSDVSSDGPPGLMESSSDEEPSPPVIDGQSGEDEGSSSGALSSGALSDSGHRSTQNEVARITTEQGADVIDQAADFFVSDQGADQVVGGRSWSMRNFLQRKIKTMRISWSAPALLETSARGRRV